jgi:hypothetical protein
MSLWGPGTECYGLKMKCLPQVHVLKTVSPVGGTILEGDEVGKWDLAEGSGSPGTH